MGQNDGRDPAEKRAHERKPCFFADVDYALAEGVFTSPIRDISMGGVFIETEAEPEMGEPVQMLFSDYSGVDFVKLSGDVVRREMAGFAVKFAGDAGGSARKLKSYINSL